MKLRTILASVAAILVTGAISYSAQIPLLTGPNCSESSQQLNCLNQLIQSVNGGVSGIVNNNQTTASGTQTTAEVTLQSFSLPANFVTNGQELEIECWGLTGATSTRKTMKIYFGTTSVSTGITNASGKAFRLNMKVNRTGAATENVGTIANLDSTSSTNYTYGATDSFATAQTIKCTGQAESNIAGEMSVGGMIVKISR